MKYRYVAQPKFWRNYRKLTPRQQHSTQQAWQLLKNDPFDPRLRTHRIEGNTAFTVNIGSHDIYKT